MLKTLQVVHVAVYQWILKMRKMRRSQLRRLGGCQTGDEAPFSSSSTAATSSTSSSFGRSSSSNGSSKGFSGPKRAHVTETAQGDADDLQQPPELEQIPEEDVEQFADAQREYQDEFPEGEGSQGAGEVGPDNGNCHAPRH